MKKAHKRKRRHHRRPAGERATLVPREGGTVGAAPGAYEVDATAPHSTIQVISYGPDDFFEGTVEKPEDVRPLLGRHTVTWVNVNGLGDKDVIDGLGQIFKLHPLALEDVVHVHQRAKVEDYGDHEFIVVRMSNMDGQLDIEQVSIFLGEGFVLTFQERPGDCLDPLRERLRSGLGRARQAGADYLAYAVLDAVVDHYFPVLETYSDRLQELEDHVLEKPSDDVTVELRDIRHDLLALRRAVWPLRDAVQLLRRDDNTHIRSETRLYLRDVQDHAAQILDLVETYRELGAGLIDIYLSTSSHRMNETMQFLTVIGSIFIPLTFITSLYGMNFDVMPELHWSWGYPVVIAAQVVVTVGLLVLFRRRGWLGRQKRR